MNMFTRRMKMLTAVVLDEDRDIVVRHLLEKGVMDFVRIDEFGGKGDDRLTTHKTNDTQDSLRDLRSRIEVLFRQAHIPTPSLEGEDVDSVGKLDARRIKKYLDNFSLSLQKIKDEQKNLNQRILAESELLKYIGEGKLEYLDLRVGRVEQRKEDFLSRMSSIGGVCVENGDDIVCLCFKRDRSRADEIYTKFNWTESDVESAQNNALNIAKSALQEKLDDEKKKLDELGDGVSAKVIEKKDELIGYWKQVRLYELSIHVESFFSYTRNTTLFSGWVPEDEYDVVADVIRTSTKGRCIIEEREAETVEREKIPSAMSSPKFLAPFEHLVNNYGVPEYGSINPTPFTAIAYFLMFMLMFADLGQGFVLLLIGIIGSNDYKKHPLKKDGLISRYLCSLLMYLGPASMIGGLLFGSCFGYSWIPALWFNYHAVVNGHGGTGLIQDIYDILGITIKFGIGVISTGLILNWINLYRKKRYFELVFDKNGLVGGVLYACGVWFGFGFVASNYKEFPTAPWFFPVIAVPIILTILKEPLHYILYGRHEEKKAVGQLCIDTLMEFIIQMLEIFSGFLANTLSFMRVAGLGIAHVSLMTAFQDMAAMTGPAFGVVIIILGNVLVTVLEGLSAGINSLRLNYYEFFTKYFTGHGIAYTPIGLSGSRKAV